MSEKKLQIKVPNRNYTVNVTDIKELTWGELEDLEDIQVSLNDESNTKGVSTISTFVRFLAPDLKDEDRRAMTTKQMNEFLGNVWRIANGLEAKAAEEETSEGKS